PVAAAVTSMSIALHTAPTVLYTPSLHDALPICLCAPARGGVLEPDPAGGLSEADRRAGTAGGGAERFRPGLYPPSAGGLPEPARSEEHTSELQSRENLVCRLLLEKTKQCTHRMA